MSSTDRPYSFSGFLHILLSDLNSWAKNQFSIREFRRFFYKPAFQRKRKSRYNACTRNPYGLIAEGFFYFPCNWVDKVSILLFHSPVKNHDSPVLTFRFYVTDRARACE